MTKHSRRGIERSQRAPRARQGRLSPDPGPWYLNYALIDRDGPFPWPAASDPEAGRLSLFLQLLNEEPLDQVLNQTRGNGDPANKSIEVADLAPAAQSRLDVIVGRLGDDVDLSIFEFTYCYRTGDPRRIWAGYEPMERRVYPIWWDPKHEVCGWDDRYAGRTSSGPCPGDCLHPHDGA